MNILEEIMCNEKKDCCCHNEKKNENKNGCDKSIPHKEKGTKDEYPCGQIKTEDDTCCCEEEKD